MGPYCAFGNKLMRKRELKEGARAKAEDQEVAAGTQVLGKEAGVLTLAGKLLLSVGWGPGSEWLQIQGRKKKR